MELIIDNKSSYLEIKDFSSFITVWNETMDTILSDERFISFVEINGEVYYDQYEIIFRDKFNEIEKIKVTTISSEDNLNQLLLSISEYTQKFIRGTNIISQYFYGELEEHHWEQFSLFLEGLNWLYQSIEFALFLMNKPHLSDRSQDPFNSIFDELNPCIKELEAALEAQDYVSVGDIMQYEVAPLFEKLIEKAIS